MKVLIAEDDLTSRTALRLALTKMGYEVSVAEEGDEAWRMISAPDAPKLAILDWMMPGMSGPEICRKLRAESTSRPVYLILLTAKSKRSDLIEGLGSGADDYIAKPFDQGELQARLNVGRRMIELQAKLAEEEKLNGVLEMAGAVCHELNQPLQALAGTAELLKKNHSEDEPDYVALESIEQNVMRLGELTRKIMSITEYKTKDYLAGQIIDLDESTVAQNASNNENSDQPNDRGITHPLAELDMSERRILVVEDDPDIRSVFEKAFTRAGYSVKTAETGEEAVEIFRATPFWVVFSDLNLPGINGVEVCRQLTEENPMVLAFAITGYASLFALTECRKAGFEDYFVKPVEVETLLACAERAFDKLDRWKNP